MRQIHELLLRQLGRLHCWQVTCPTCRRPGLRTARPEADLLTRTHNGMQHRGRPVAATRIAVGRPRSAALLGWVTR